MTLLGNLGRDPALPQTTQGRAVAMSPLAPHDLWRDEHGERQQHTQWHNIVVWGKQAERCEQYLAKGRHVYIEGALRSRFYDDNVGEKRSMVEIVARQVQFLGGGMGKLEAGEGEEGEIWETEPLPAAEEFRLRHGGDVTQRSQNSRLCVMLGNVIKSGFEVCVM